MNMYRRLGDQVATSEARDLAEQLVAWHDAMVKHVRVLGARPEARCDEDCPHEAAAGLWMTAQATFGTRARELAFLRSHGEPARVATPARAPERAAEMHV